MATTLKASLVLNVRLNMGSTPEEQPTIPFGIVHNANGTALINWTVGKMAPKSGAETNYLFDSEVQYDLSQLGEIKLNQLNHISVNGFGDTMVFIHQVVEGKVRTIEEKIAKIAAEAENGSRHLIVVEEESSSTCFYKALGLADANGKPLADAAQMLPDGVLTIEAPYERYQYPV